MKILLAAKLKPLCIMLLMAAALILPGTAFTQGLAEPLVYPHGVIGTARPSFIWQDIYNAREPEKAARFRLTITPGDETQGKPAVLLINPQVYYQAFFAFELPAPLADGAYEYSIEKMDGATAVTGKYYHYLHYPIKKKFSIDASKPGDLDRLPTEHRIQYLYLDRKNVLENGYNAMFFAGSGVLSFGIGMLFYTVIDFGIISTIVYVVAFTSSATGLAASGVYTYRYYRERGRLQKILGLPGGSAIRGNITRDGIRAEVEMRY